MSCLISVLTLYASWAGWQKAKPGILCILIWCPCLIRNLEFPPLKPCRQNSVCNTYTYHVDEVVIVPNSTCLPQSAPGMHHALCSSVQLPAQLLALFLYSVSIQVLVWVIRRNFKCSQLKKKKKEQTSYKQISNEIRVSMVHLSVQTVHLKQWSGVLQCSLEAVESRWNVFLPSGGFHPSISFSQCKQCDYILRLKSHRKVISI